MPGGHPMPEEMLQFLPFLPKLALIVKNWRELCRELPHLVRNDIDDSLGGFTIPEFWGFPSLTVSTENLKYFLQNLFSVKYLLGIDCCPGVQGHGIES